MPTALTEFAQHLALTDGEVATLRALLSMSPVAARGEPTLVPTADLHRAFWPGGYAGDDIDAAIAKRVEPLVLTQRKIKRGLSTWSFPVLDEFELRAGAPFLNFKFNRTFCEGLRGLVESRGLELF
jgi:hypothetical protein